MLDTLKNIPQTASQDILHHYDLDAVNASLLEQWTSDNIGNPTPTDMDTLVQQFQGKCQRCRFRASCKNYGAVGFRCKHHSTCPNYSRCLCQADCTYHPDDGTIFYEANNSEAALISYIKNASKNPAIAEHYFINGADVRKIAEWIHVLTCLTMQHSKDWDSVVQGYKTDHGLLYEVDGVDYDTDADGARPCCLWPTASRIMPLAPFPLEMFRGWSAGGALRLPNHDFAPFLRKKTKLDESDRTKLGTGTILTNFYTLGHWQFRAGVTSNDNIVDATRIVAGEYAEPYIYQIEMTSGIYSGEKRYVVDAVNNFNYAPGTDPDYEFDPDDINHDEHNPLRVARGVVLAISGTAIILDTTAVAAGLVPAKTFSSPYTWRLVVVSGTDADEKRDITKAETETDFFFTDKITVASAITNLAVDDVVDVYMQVPNNKDFIVLDSSIDALEGDTFDIYEINPASEFDYGYFSWQQLCDILFGAVAQIRTIQGDGQSTSIVQPGTTSLTCAFGFGHKNAIDRTFQSIPEFVGVVSLEHKYLTNAFFSFYTFSYTGIKSLFNLDIYGDYQPMQGTWFSAFDIAVWECGNGHKFGTYIGKCPVCGDSTTTTIYPAAATGTAYEYYCSSCENTAPNWQELYKAVIVDANTFKFQCLACGVETGSFTTGDDIDPSVLPRRDNPAGTATESRKSFLFDLVGALYANFLDLPPDGHNCKSILAGQNCEQPNAIHTERTKGRRLYPYGEEYYKARRPVPFKHWSELETKSVAVWDKHQENAFVQIAESTDSYTFTYGEGNRIELFGLRGRFVYFKVIPMTEMPEWVQELNPGRNVWIDMRVVDVPRGGRFCYFPVDYIDGAGESYTGSPAITDNAIHKYVHPGDIVEFTRASDGAKLYMLVDDVDPLFPAPAWVWLLSGLDVGYVDYVGARYQQFYNTIDKIGLPSNIDAGFQETPISNIKFYRMAASSTYDPKMILQYRSGQNSEYEMELTGLNTIFADGGNIEDNLKYKLKAGEFAKIETDFALYGGIHCNNFTFETQAATRTPIVDANIIKELGRMGKNALSQYLLPVQFTRGGSHHTESSWDGEASIRYRTVLNFSGKTETYNSATPIVDAVPDETATSSWGNTTLVLGGFNISCPDCIPSVAEFHYWENMRKGIHYSSGVILALDKGFSNLLYLYRNWFKPLNMKIFVLPGASTYVRNESHHAGYIETPSGADANTQIISYYRNVFPPEAYPNAEDDCPACIEMEDAIDVKYIAKRVIIEWDKPVGESGAVVSSITIDGGAASSAIVSAAKKGHPQYVELPPEIFEHIYGAQDSKKQYGLFFNVAGSKWGTYTAPSGDIVYSDVAPDNQKEFGTESGFEVLEANFSVLGAYAEMESQKIL